MRRWILRTLCLILGAITTVAVAWGCALVVNVYQPAAIGPRAVLLTGATEWRAYRRSALGVTTIHSSRNEHSLPEAARSTSDGDIGKIIPDESDLQSFRPTHWLLWHKSWPQAYIVKVDDDYDIQKVLDSGGFGSLQDDRTHDFRGWPARALWNEIVYEGYVGEFHCNGGYETGLKPFQLAQDLIPRTLPFRPVWPGFVIDTLFYAAIWFGVFFGFTSAKRFIRTKRGRCPRCGYDVRGALDTGCSECRWGRENAQSANAQTHKAKGVGQ